MLTPALPHVAVWEGSLVCAVKSAYEQSDVVALVDAEAAFVNPDGGAVVVP
jgi:hypothetical protein